MNADMKSELDEYTAEMDYMESLQVGDKVGEAIVVSVTPGLAVIEDSEGNQKTISRFR